jgi:transposase-like protein
LEFFQRDRAVRMTLDRLSDYPSVFSACKALAPKLGVGPETLRRWVVRGRIDAGEKAGPSSEELEEIDAIVLQAGVTDVAASKQFYLDHGMSAGKSYGIRYVELDTGPIKLTLNKRGALAKTAGVSPDGTGSHRLVIGSDAGAFTDSDGFVWEAPMD